MYKGKSILAVVPARGGSTGIPWKNLCTIGGKTLVRLAIECAQAVPEIDQIVCSTNRERIAVEAVSAGAMIRKRPEAISNGDVGDAVVLLDALEGMVVDYDVIVMLQPTSPSRTPEMVSQAIHRLIDGELDSVWTVSPTDLHYHPLKQLILYDDGELDFWDDDGAKVKRRQDLVPTYTRNGVCYAMTRRTLLVHGNTFGIKWGALVIPGDHLSIDTVEDLRAHHGELPVSTE